MDSSDTSNHSLSTDEVEEELLQQQYDALLEKVNTQRLILAAVREVNAEQVTDVTDDERKNIDRALNYARAFECLKLDDKGTNIMGISNKPPELAYFEQKALCEKIFEQIESKYKEELQYIQNMDPKVLDSTALDQELLEAKQRENQLIDELAEKEAQLCATLEQCTELKVDNPDLIKSMQLVHESASKHEGRAEVLKGLLQSKTSADIGAKAKQIIETYIDREIDRHHAAGSHSSQNASH